MFLKKIAAVVVVLWCIIYPGAKSQNYSKLCQVRNMRVYREVWNHWTGFYCYNYTNDYRLLFRYKKFLQVTYNNLIIPATYVNDTTYFWFDYLNETSLSYIRPSFKPEFFTLWLDCCQEAVTCCDDFMTSENIQVTDDYPCGAVWDGWTCFGPAKANTIEHVVCSKQAYSTLSEVCELNSEKQCFANGWNDTTNYATCANAPILRNRHNFNVVTLAVSAVVSYPAVVIFFSFRKFRSNLRLILHRNLILIIVVRNLLSIMTKEIIILDALKTNGSNNVMAYNGVGCRILAFFENVAKNGMYACMLADGFYLHKMIVRAFANDPSISVIYSVVAALSFVPSLIWATKRGASNGQDCWMVDHSSDQWITDGFRIAVLAINFCFLLDIVRVFIWKLRRQSAGSHTKSTLRATAFLLPLFGIHIFVISDRNIIPGKSCASEDIYYYLSYTIEGLQGVMVSILFCYINAEVRKELQNAFRKMILYFQAKSGVEFNIKNNNKTKNRRATATTVC